MVYRYTLFWVSLLASKLAFSYFAEVYLNPSLNRKLYQFFFLMISDILS